MAERMEIDGRAVGKESPVFVVAEISCNHMQDKDLAMQLIKEAGEAGADAVKFQSYTPDSITLDVDNEYFRIEGTAWEGKRLYDLYEEAYTPPEWFPDLKDKAEDEGLIFFSSVFSGGEVERMEDLGVPAYKVASFEIQHIPLLERIAETGKPVILSTGIATEDDIELALETLRENGAGKISLLQCTSAYPAPPEEANLRTIPDMAERFDVVPGLSDHTQGIAVPATAVALGASIVEKHFILDRELHSDSPDAEFSLEPQEFSDMVDAVQTAEKSLGKVTYDTTESVEDGRSLGRSIFASENIGEGETFTDENIKVVRPGNGMHPKYYDELINKQATGKLEKGEPVKPDDVSGGIGG